MKNKITWIRPCLINKKKKKKIEGAIFPLLPRLIDEYQRFLEYSRTNIGTL